LPLNDAQVDIEAIAERLGLKFIQLCDFATTPGSKAYSGAFCGVFVSDGGKFVGVAFKGTSNLKEAKEDVWITVREAEAPILYGTKVHSGFYYGLFDTFNQGGDTVQPFAMIMNGLRLYDAKYYLHVTGHSLGAAYATLLHCELNRLVTDPEAPKVTIKDMLTFGSPRTGLNDFANKFGENMWPNQKSWRFANRFDLVTVLPPRGLGYTHVDAGYTLYKNQEPEPIPSERTASVEDTDEGDPEVYLPFHGIATYYKYVDRIST